MTQIAKGLIGLRNASIKKTYPVSLLPAWLLNSTDPADERCVMTDLSSGGAAILVPRSQASQAESFDLVFMSPDNEDEILTTLPAEQRWRDEQHSPDYVKIGVAFLEMDAIKVQVINAMIEIFNLKNTIARPGISKEHFKAAVKALK